MLRDENDLNARDPIVRKHYGNRSLKTERPREAQECVPLADVFFDFRPSPSGVDGIFGIGIDTGALEVRGLGQVVFGADGLSLRLQ